MVKKTKCPHCGKAIKSGHHISRCLKNPQNEDISQPDIEISVEEKNTMDLYRQRYASQIKYMSPDKADKFIRKARGL